MKKKPADTLLAVHCRDCRLCRIVTDNPNAFSTEGKPLLGECPHVTNRRVLLSETACPRYQP